MRSSASEIGRRSRGATTTAVASLLLMVMFTLAGVALSAADRSVESGLSYQHETETLMLAESSIEYAMGQLDMIRDWKDLELPVTNFLAARTIGRGVVWADIQNDVYDEGGSKDTNGMILIKGHAQLGNSTQIFNLETLYWRPSFVIPPIAGVNICGYDNLDANGGPMVVSGFNHYLPPAPCSGSHCDAERNFLPPDVIGIAFEIEGRETKVSLPRTVEGAPAIASGVCSLRGPTGLCARARMLFMNAQRFVGLESITEWPATGKGTYGSVTDPKLILVEKGTELRLHGTAQGAGVLFVAGTLTIVGTFTFTGAIIVGPGAVLDQKGTANIFGSIITVGNAQLPATYLMKGSGTAAWAGDAIQVGPANFPALMASWRDHS